MKTYNFQEQLKRGECAERRLDKHFRNHGYKVTPATRQQQRQGIDRVFVTSPRRKRLLVEYKADWTAAETGNVFIETISVKRNGRQRRRGWAFTSKADWLIYFFPEDDLAYCISFVHLRDVLDKWIAKYPAHSIPNERYTTHGIVVPQMVLERLAVAVRDVFEGGGKGC